MASDSDAELKWYCRGCHTGFETTMGAIDHAIRCSDQNIYPQYTAGGA